ncbi:hypothetical protein ACFL1X_09580 [Candidatus Hydrogenedentota bacterium]
MPPHDIIGRPVDTYSPQGEGADLVMGLMRDSRKILAEHPINRDRISRGKAPATSIWLWGQGMKPEMKRLEDNFGLTGVVISAVDLVKGIGKCAGLEVIEVPGATGYLDTNYDGKRAAALEALDKVDFAYVHLEAPDEASHEGNVTSKIKAIEDFDAKIVGPIVETLSQRDACRVMVAPDHITSLEKRTHTATPVPFAFAGSGIEPCGIEAYTEAQAESTGIFMENGQKLMEEFLK